jgi:hypothetical protein
VKVLRHSKARRKNKIKISKELHENGCKLKMMNEIWESLTL